MHLFVIIGDFIRFYKAFVEHIITFHRTIFSKHLNNYCNELKRIIFHDQDVFTICKCNQMFQTLEKTFNYLELI